MCTAPDKDDTGMNYVNEIQRLHEIIAQYKKERRVQCSREDVRVKDMIQTSSFRNECVHAILCYKKHRGINHTKMWDIVNIIIDRIVYEFE